MAIDDIVSPAGDGQDLLVEIPTGNGAYVPADILIETDEVLTCAEIPEIIDQGGGGNIFIMSE